MRDEKEIRNVADQAQAEGELNLQQRSETDMAFLAGVFSALTWVLGGEPSDELEKLIDRMLPSVFDSAAFVTANYRANRKEHTLTWKQDPDGTDLKTFCSCGWDSGTFRPDSHNAFVEHILVKVMGLTKPDTKET